MKPPSERAGGIIVWLRRDLRLRDNPALWHAAERGRMVWPLFIHSPDEEHAAVEGAAGRWWLSRSLAALSAGFEEAGSTLVIRRGPVEEEINRFCDETGASAVYWNRRYEPALVKRDRRIAESLRARGCEVKTFNGALLFDPAGIHTRQEQPFRVFTPFWNRCLEQEVEKPFEAPVFPPRSGKKVSSVDVADLGLPVERERARRLSGIWQPGEDGARRKLAEFTKTGLDRYLEDRDFPARDGVSGLSPHIHFGEIGVRETWSVCRGWAQRRGTAPARREAAGFFRELGWREFSHHVLFHFPETVDQPLRREFSRFPWRDSMRDLNFWKEGMTGYPMVDAGMRQLRATGWMHNRARMIVASFLVKHLLISWLEGAAWFWENLVDADLANNTMGWQWSAGCGADAAPYFRVFNPTLQGRKFDPEGDYVRKWVPELAPLPAKWIHDPAGAPACVLEKAGVVAGKTYPAPMADHRKARERALAAFQKIRRGVS